MNLPGFDAGSSAVKAALIDAESGRGGEPEAVYRELDRSRREDPAARLSRGPVEAQPKRIPREK